MPALPIEKIDALQAQNNSTHESGNRRENKNMHRRFQPKNKIQSNYNKNKIGSKVSKNLVSGQAVQEQARDKKNQNWKPAKAANFDENQKTGKNQRFKN